MAAPKGNQNAKGNKGGKGAPTKYLRKYATMARKAYEAGFTDREVADLIGVAENTIAAWKVAHIEFAEALKVGKGVADDRVERSLYARATGYEHDEVDIRAVKGKIIKTPIRKIYPPDTVAAIFWLKNRRRGEWRDKHDYEHTGKDGGPLVVAATTIDEAL